MSVSTMIRAGIPVNVVNTNKTVNASPMVIAGIPITGIITRARASTTVEKTSNLFSSAMKVMNSLLSSIKTSRASLIANSNQQKSEEDNMISQILNRIAIMRAGDEATIIRVLNRIPEMRSENAKKAAFQAIKDCLNLREQIKREPAAKEALRPIVKKLVENRLQVKRSA
jgi:hypothetical protein